MKTAEQKFFDAAGAAESFIHAMKSLFETAFEGGDHKMDDYCALHLLADNAIREIREARLSFEGRGDK
ncbi:hypothetical protein [Agrobacterium cavarae]|uniref:hypothetical protein n=1 Tax=Agrobacterium cavarae TaxID=2528239 RepID=UPI0028975144|nr:hypothetical protein [Agrobacterium cavarae]